MIYQEFKCKPAEDKNRREDEEEMPQAVIHRGSANKDIGCRKDKPDQNKCQCNELVSCSQGSLKRRGQSPTPAHTARNGINRCLPDEFSIPNYQAKYEQDPNRFRQGSGKHERHILTW